MPAAVPSALARSPVPGVSRRSRSLRGLRLRTQWGEAADMREDDRCVGRHRHLAGWSGCVFGVDEGARQRGGCRACMGRGAQRELQRGRRGAALRVWGRGTRQRARAGEPGGRGQVQRRAGGVARAGPVRPRSQRRRWADCPRLQTAGAAHEVHWTQAGGTVRGRCRAWRLPTAVRAGSCRRELGAAEAEVAVRVDVGTAAEERVNRPGEMDLVVLSSPGYGPP